MATQESIEVMLLQGAIPAYTSHEQYEHRFMTDVEMFVRERDFTRLRKALEDLTYQTSIPQLHKQDLPRYSHYYPQNSFKCHGKPPAEMQFRSSNEKRRIVESFGVLRTLLQ